MLYSVELSSDYFPRFPPFLNTFVWLHKQYRTKAHDWLIQKHPRKPPWEVLLKVKRYGKGLTRRVSMEDGCSGLWAPANAWNVSFRISLRWPIHIINPVDKTKLSRKHDMLGNRTFRVLRPLNNILHQSWKVFEFVDTFSSSAETSNQVFLCPRILETTMRPISEICERYRINRACYVCAQLERDMFFCHASTLKSWPTQLMGHTRRAWCSAPSCDHFGRHGEWKKVWAIKILAKVANWRPTD